MSLKAVVFDLDGVYFLNGTENFYKNISEKYRVPVSKVEALYKTSDPYMRPYKLGEITGDKYWAHFREELGIEDSTEDILKILVAGYEINEQAESLRRELVERGVKACICSNNFAERINVLDERFDLLSKFSVRVFSYKEHALKPDKPIFETLIRKTGVAPAEIFFADDQAKNLTVPKELGINVSLYEDFAGFKSAIQKLL